jgi:hypothetical protein
MDELMESLYKIPILGLFFKMIFGNFFDGFDSIQDIADIDGILDAL